MKRILFRAETIYKNKARMQVDVLNKTHKNWELVEPKDIIRVKLTNKQYLKEPVMDILMRPDEAQRLVILLSEALHYNLKNIVK